MNECYSVSLGIAVHSFGFRVNRDRLILYIKKGKEKKKKIQRRALTDTLIIHNCPYIFLLFFFWAKIEETFIKYQVFFFLKVPVNRLILYKPPRPFKFYENFQRT